jgi:microcystin-dependent protein
MAQPFIGQLLLVGFNFRPVGYTYCDGALLAISQNDALFQLIGTTYGGDGQNTFGLPDLRGRTTIHAGTGPGLSSYVLGQMGGVESITLTSAQMPAHTHASACSSAAQASNDPSGAVPAVTADNRYGVQSPAVPMGAMISTMGGSQPHENRQPYLALNWLIALQGVFPSQN